MTTEKYLFLCNECGLSSADLEVMTIGMTIDYIDEYISSKYPEQSGANIREATQDDFDRF